MLDQYDFQDQDYYPCIFINKNNTILTCWFYADNSQLLKNNNGGIAYFFSEEDMKNDLFLNRKVKVHYDQSTTYKIINFFKSIQHLQAYVGVSKESCELILNQLNIMEDILYTLDISNHDYKLPRMKVILDKLLYGCNLPALEHPEYHPTFKPYDIKVLKRVSRNTWWKIIKNEPIFK